MAPEIKEKLEFCATICMAARNLGFYIRPERDGALIRYVWFDPMQHQHTPGEPAQDSLEALFNSCQTLVNLIAVSPKDSSKPSPTSGL